ncbi:hypothetical protein pb186bvf_015117 [Paramecium bursaria]
MLNLSSIFKSLKNLIPNFSNLRYLIQINLFSDKLNQLQSEGFILIIEAWWSNK